MLATIYHIPRRFMGDPREPVVRDPYAEMSQAEKMQRCADIDAIGHLVERYGFYQVRQWVGAPPMQANPIRTLIDRYDVDTVARWVRYHAWRVGQETVERPANRCLADGAVLPATKICVQCGRDNS
jgi:hypothetical protein